MGKGFGSAVGGLLTNSRGSGRREALEENHAGLDLPAAPPPTEATAEGGDRAWVCMCLVFL